MQNKKKKKKIGGLKPGKPVNVFRKISSKNSINSIVI